MLILFECLDSTEFFLRSFIVGVSFDVYHLLVISPQLVRQGLHLGDVLQLALPLVRGGEVPQYVLFVVAAVDDSPEIEAVRPNAHLAVLADRDQPLEGVWVHLLDPALVSHHFPNYQAHVFWVLHLYRRLLPS